MSRDANAVSPLMLNLPQGPEKHPFCGSGVSNSCEGQAGKCRNPEACDSSVTREREIGGVQISTAVKLIRYNTV